MFAGIIVRRIRIVCVVLIGVASTPIIAQENSKHHAVILTTHGTCMLGHVEDKKFIPADERIRLPANFISPDKYDLYRLNEIKKGVQASSLTLQEYPCSNRYYVNFKPEVKTAYTALGNITWNPQPRPFKVLDKNSPIYKKIIAGLLKEKGIDKPRVRIVQIVKTDIQGDGKDEVLISATYFTPNKNGPEWEHAPMYVKKGDYSFIALREVIDEKPVTSIVVGEVFLSNSVSPEIGVPPPAPDEFHIGSILDVNGDGVMELIVDNTIHEGMGAFLFFMENGKFVEKVSCGCGF